MKVGDKLICIKPFKLGNSRNCNVNKWYEVMCISDNIIDGQIIYRIGNIWYTEVDDKVNPYCYDYFMSAAEYREQQINSILE